MEDAQTFQIGFQIYWMQLQVILLGISTLSISCFDADKHEKRAVADREKKNKQKCIRSMLMLNMPTPYVIEITRIKRQNYSV